MTAKNLGAQTRELLRRAGNESRAKAKGAACADCGAPIIDDECVGCRGECSACDEKLIDGACQNPECELAADEGSDKLYRANPMLEPMRAQQIMQERREREQ